MEKKGLKFPDPLWSWVRFAVLTFPYFPNLGILAFIGSMGWQWKRHYPEIVRSPLNKLWGILALWLILTTILAVKPVAALEGLGNFLPQIAFFVAFHHLFNNFQQLYQLAWWLVLSALPVTFSGFLQLLGWKSWAIVGVFGTKLVPYGNPQGRMSSVFMYANTLAGFLITTFTLSVGLCIIYYQKWQAQKTKIRRYQLIILGICVIFNALSLILTYSRSAWGLLFLICVSFALYLGWRWLILALGTAAMSVLWAAWGPIGREPLRQVIPAYFWARLSDELYPDRYMTAFRSTQWQIAWEMWLQHPWLGWGLRNFSPYYKMRMNTWLGHPHNLYLMLLAEIGMIGTILFCGLIAYLMGRSVYYYGSLESKTPPLFEQKTLLFSYLLAFSSSILFNALDITIFDLRVNLINWLILAAFSGVAFSQLQTEK